MHRALLLSQVLGQLHAALLTADVSWQRMQTARAGVVRLDRVLQLLLPPASDVDLGAIGDERLGDHEPNASAAAGHDCGEM